MSSSGYLPFNARVICSVIYFTKFSLHFGNSVLVIFLLMFLAENFQLVRFFWRAAHPRATLKINECNDSKRSITLVVRPAIGYAQDVLY